MYDVLAFSQLTLISVGLEEHYSLCTIQASSSSDVTMGQCLVVAINVSKVSGIQ